MREFAVDTPAVAIVHAHDVGLAHGELAEDNHARPGGVDAGALVEEVGGGLRSIEPDSGVAADPVGYHGGVELEGELFEVDPWLVQRELEGVANDGPRERAGREFSAEEKDACVVDDDGERDECQEKEESVPLAKAGEGVGDGGEGCHCGQCLQCGISIPVALTTT